MTMDNNEIEIFKSKANSYITCWNQDCTEKEHCLRHIMCDFVPEENKTLQVVNPRANGVGGKSCIFLSYDNKVKVYRGFTHLYDNVPTSIAKRVKAKLEAHFGHNGYYFRRRGKQFTTQSEAKEMTAIFNAEGWTQPLEFDNEAMEYEW